MQHNPLIASLSGHLDVPGHQEQRSRLDRPTPLWQGLATRFAAV